jgi:plasmid stabilization system protein ParE
VKKWKRILARKAPPPVVPDIHDRVGPPPAGSNHLAEIWDFLSSDSIDAADKVAAAILKAIRTLVPFPPQGHRRPDLSSRAARFISIYDYLIGLPDCLCAGERPLWVVAVMHGHRNPRVRAAILRGRENRSPGSS